jgi:hypothetical protein
VQGGYDAFLRRDAKNLLGPIERSGITLYNPYLSL